MQRPMNGNKSFALRRKPNEMDGQQPQAEKCLPVLSKHVQDHVPYYYVHMYVIHTENHNTVCAMACQIVSLSSINRPPHLDYRIRVGDRHEIN